MFQLRLERLIAGIRASGFDAVALNPSPSMVYVTGLPFHLMERPTVLLVTVTGGLMLVMPELESAKLQQAPYSLQSVRYGDNPATWQAAFDEATRNLDLGGKKIGVESNWLRFLELSLLQRALPDAHFEGADQLFATFRVQKDPQELACMRKAVEIAQAALMATTSAIKAGVSERSIASELTAQLLRHGSDPQSPFSPIVSSGANSANPHATPSDRVLQHGDLLVIDWGASYQGYFSDLTRTFAIGEVESEFRQIAEIVARANQTGRSTARSGLTAGAVDHAVRQVIEDSGYGAYFTHRTGHGLGMEIHEPPYIYGENTLVLVSGMTFTIEPGIYLPGRGGVRIEDNVAVTTDGCETLSSLPRELFQL